MLSNIRRINEMSVVYFTRGDDAATLNRAALYVLENEQTQRMVVVHIDELEALFDRFRVRFWVPYTRAREAQRL